MAQFNIFHLILINYIHLYLFVSQPKGAIVCKFHFALKAEWVEIIENSDNVNFLDITTNSTFEPFCVHNV